MTKITERIKAVLLTALLTAAATANADALESHMSAWLVKQQENNEVLKPAGEAGPGDVIEYRMTYKNTQASPLSALTISVPVPDNTAYVAESAATPVKSQFEASIDGGKTWEHEPIKRLRKTAEGKLRMTDIPVSEYTNIRWLAENPIQPAEQQAFTYRVQVK